MGFFSHVRGQWSLEGVPRPFSGQSLYAYVREKIDPKTGRLPACLDGRLPDEKFGVAGQPMGTSEAQLRVQEVVEALGALATDATDNALSVLYELVTRESAPELIDAVMQEVRKSALEREHIHAIGLVLASEAPKRGAVMFGIALLGTVPDPDDRELLTTLGTHDEFTPLAAVALVNLGDDAELELFELAKRVESWGRFHLVQRLADAKHPEVRAWLLREGFRNSVMMEEFLAHTAATAGGLHTALSAESVDAELIGGAADIFVALARADAPRGLADYPHAAEAIDAWLSHVEKQPLSLDVLEALDALDGSEAVAPPLKARVAERRRHPGIPELIERGLASPEPALLWPAYTLAKRRGIDTFEPHRAALERGSGDPRYLFWRMMQDVTESTLERALLTAKKRIDLSKVASGPAKSTGFGPEFAPLGLLANVLGALARFPGRGTEFLLAGLRSPAQTNRNAALRALAGWGRDRWPPDVVEAVTSAAAIEPVADVKARMERVLGGGPFGDPAGGAPPGA